MSLCVSVNVLPVAMICAFTGYRAMMYELT